MTQSPPPSYSPQQALSPSDEKLWSTLVHVGGIIIGFISPLLVYLILKDRSRFVEAHSKTALNFQITISGIQIANAIVGFILVPLTLGLWLIIQILVLLVVLVVNVIFSAIAAVAANRGNTYTYPLTPKWIK